MMVSTTDARVQNKVDCQLSDILKNKGICNISHAKWRINDQTVIFIKSCIKVCRFTAFFLNWNIRVIINNNAINGIIKTYRLNCSTINVFFVFTNCDCDLNDPLFSLFSFLNPFRILDIYQSYRRFYLPHISSGKNKQQPAFALSPFHI